jgi:hypothetical protein
LSPPGALLIDEVTYGGQMGAVLAQRGRHGAFQGGGTVRVQESNKPAGERAEIGTALCGAGEQCGRAW